MRSQDDILVMEKCHYNKMLDGSYICIHSECLVRSTMRKPLIGHGNIFSIFAFCLDSPDGLALFALSDIDKLFNLLVQAFRRPQIPTHAGDLVFWGTFQALRL